MDERKIKYKSRYETTIVLHILSPVWKLLTQNKNGTGQTIIFGSSITKGTNTRELRDNVDVDTNRGETIAIMKDKIIKLDLSSYKNIFLQLGRNNAGKDSPTIIYKEYSEILKDIITEDPNKHIISLCSTTKTTCRCITSEYMFEKTQHWLWSWISWQLQCLHIQNKQNNQWVIPSWQHSSFQNWNQNTTWELQQSHTNYQTIKIW